MLINLYYFYAINALDVYTTYRGVRTKKAEELNPLLSSSPELSELIIFKIVWGAAVLNTIDYELLYYPNYVITYAVINNLHVLNDINEL